MAQSVIFSIDQGSDTVVNVSVSGPDGVPLDFAGASALMHMRVSVGAEVIADELSTENARIEFLSDPGTLALKFPHADTSALDAGTYVYDLEITSASGVVTRIMEGRITIRPEITRDASDASDASD